MGRHRTGFHGVNQSAGWQGSRNALRPFFVLWFSMLVMQCILAGDGVRAVLAAGLHSKGRAAFCPLLCAGARAKFPALISGHSDGLRGLRRERFCAGRRVASESRRTFFGDSWILEKNIGRSKLLSGRRHTSLEMVLSDEKGRRKRDQYPSLPFDFETAAMPEHLDQIMSPPVMFARLKEEARKYESSLLLSHQMQKHILLKDALSASIASVLSSKLANEDLPEHLLFNRLFKELDRDPKLTSDMVADLIWIQEIDPATHGYLQPFLYFKGFHAVQVQRIAHNLWIRGDPVSKMLALSLQSRAAEVFGVDAHPGAKLAYAICLDHATGVVIGETASIGHHCYILHGVTLGATGKTGKFDRHPKVKNRVKIGAGAMILGDIPLGNDVVVGAAAIVTIPIKDGDTVVGINRVLSSEQKKEAADANKCMETWLYSI